jgi:hypothetical protein
MGNKWGDFCNHSLLPQEVARCVMGRNNPCRLLVSLCWRDSAESLEGPKGYNSQSGGLNRRVLRRKGALKIAEVDYSTEVR